jgi:hypothetical protein
MGSLVKVIAHLGQLDNMVKQAGTARSIGPKIYDQVSRKETSQDTNS